MSGCRMQIILVITAPHIEIGRRIYEVNLDIKGSSVYIRIRPYLPNFSKIAAKIIDPATGASTWAFGSHRWDINIGIFTKKAKDIVTHHKNFIFVGVVLDQLNKINEDEFILYEMINIEISRGSDAVTVYNIK